MNQDLSQARGSGRASQAGNTRKAGKEQYYTPVATAQAMMANVLPHIPDLAERVFIEPAAGTGAFLDAARALGVKRLLAYDIDPQGPGIEEEDFLKFDLPPGLTGAVAITNPPFGRNSSLSVPFFNRLAPHCTHIGFVVPKSWRKWSIHNRLDPHFHLIHDEELSIDYVDAQGASLAGSSGQLRTVFQLWERRGELRERVEVQDCGLFRRVKPETADVALTIFGRGCGTVNIEFPRRPNTTRMYLELLDPLGLEALQNANLAQFFNNVAHVEALSWPEINFAVNQWLQAQDT